MHSVETDGEEENQDIKPHIEAIDKSFQKFDCESGSWSHNHVTGKEWGEYVGIVSLYPFVVKHTLSHGPGNHELLIVVMISKPIMSYVLCPNN